MIDDLNKLCEYLEKSTIIKVVRHSIGMPIEQSLLNEDYYLYQCTSQTPVVKRFKQASQTNF